MSPWPSLLLLLLLLLLLTNAQDLPLAVFCSQMSLSTSQGIFLLSVSGVSLPALNGPETSLLPRTTGMREEKASA